MQDRFKFRAVVKGYYYIDTSEKYEEYEPLIFLPKVDVLGCDNIGISEEDLENEIRKQYPNIKNENVEYMLEYFKDNSYGIDTYITIEPEKIYQCTGLKDKNGKLIYEGDIVKFAEYDWSDFAFKDWEQEITEIIWGGEHNYPAFDLKIQNFDCNGLAYIFEEGWQIEVIGNIYKNAELLSEVK